MKESSSVRKLISFAFDLMKLGGSNTYGRIPFQLFADLLEGQTISCAEKLWNLLESFTDSITVPEYFRCGNDNECEGFETVIISYAILSHTMHYKSQTLNKNFILIMGISNLNYREIYRLEDV